MLALLLTGLAEVTAQSQKPPVNPKSETERLFKQANEHFAKQEYDKTFPLLQQALAINEKAYGSNHVQVAEVLFIAGGIHRAKGDFANAMPLLQRCLAIRESFFGKQDTNLVEALIMLGLTCRAQEANAPAIEYFERCLSIHDGQPGGNDAAAHSLLDNLAKLYRSQSDYRKAIAALQRSQSIKQRLFGKDSVRVADCAHELALVHEDIGDYPKAKEFFEQSLVAQEQRKSRPGQFALCLSNVAAFQRKLGDFAAAFRLYEQAVTAMKQANLAETTEMAGILGSFAGYHRAVGNLAMARQLRQQALGILEKQYGSEHPQIAPALANLANVEGQLGHYETALSLHKRSMAITENAFGRDHRDYAIGLGALAGFYSSQGRFAQALRLHEQSLAIITKLVGTNHLDVAATLNNLGSVHADLGNYPDAMRCFLESLKVKERILGTRNLDVAIALNNLAEVYATIGNTTSALNLYEEGLLILVETVGTNSPLLATTLSNLGLVHKMRADPKLALACFTRSLDIKQRIYGESHPDVAITLNNLADFYQDQGDALAATPLYQRSLSIKRAFVGEDHPDVALALANLATVLMAQGKLTDGISTSTEGVRLQRRWLLGQLGHLSTSGSLRLAGMGHFTLEMLHTACSIGPGTAAGAEQAALNKALLEEIQSAQTALEASTGTATQELREQLQATLVRLAGLAESKLEPMQRDARRRELQAELSQLEAKLAERVGLVAQTVRERNLSLADIARSLPPQSALVDFVHYRRYDFAAKTNLWKEAHYAAYVTFPPAAGTTNFAVERVDLGEAAPINAAVAELHQLFAERRIAPQRLEPVLQRLGALLHTPLARHLTNVAHLIVCPDGQLGRLPFELLPVDAKGRRLVEDKLITYVSSGREVARLTQPRAAVATTAPLVMGNPDFDFILPGSSRREEAPIKPGTQNAELGTDSLSLLTSAATSRQRFLSRSFRDFKFTPLPDSEHEARKAAAMLGTNCVLRLGASAREADLKAVSSPRVLHLATHGFFLTDQEFKRTNGLAENFLLAGSFPSGGGFPSRQSFAPPGQDWENPLIRCGIALAGANRATGITNAQAEDGILTGLEAALLNLQGTELVILSACDSGSGDVKIGEGVMSLRRAFTIAGAETVLASHWKVNDAATSTLMTEFMRRWQAGTPRGQAWREAQLSLLRSKEFSNPYFWAAFTLTGQWR